MMINHYSAKRLIIKIFFFFGLLPGLIALTGFSKELPLPPEKAFVFSAHHGPGQQLTLQWDIAPGYYLYRDKLQITPASTTGENPAKIHLPHGILKQDSILGVYEIYSGTLKISVPLTSWQNHLILDIHYQGCAQSGFCYSPISRRVSIDANRLSVTSIEKITSANTSVFLPEGQYAEKILAQHNSFIITLSFLSLGLLLAFTPCTLPMIPILSGIIIGHHKKKSAVKAFSLSLIYVLGMAITYALAGIVAALIGDHIQTELQRPWVIMLFSGAFILLALSLFGLYEFQLPPAWQKRLTQWSGQQKSGSYLGAFIMGSLSTLIVSPCISPALVGTLAYIAHTGNVWLGGLALLALGLGMGLPLLFVGISLGRLLPQAGAWMQTIEHLVGTFMLAFAIWLLSRIIPGPLALLLWSILLIGSAVIFGKFHEARNNWQHLRHGTSSAALIYGIVLLAGAILGNSDPLHPLENWNTPLDRTSRSASSLFIPVKNMSQLDERLARAKKEKKRAVLDFSAQWCESCVRMDHEVWNQPQVKWALRDFIRLRVDVTENNSFDHAVLKRFAIIAPPALLFFSSDEKELTRQRTVGEITAKELLAHIEEITLAGTAITK